jgi:sterol 14-demethylase
MRALSCAEIADDHALVSHIKKLYDKLDTVTTPASILLPWCPSWTLLSKLWSTNEIYNIIVKAVKQRQELLSRIGEGGKPQDTMQLLLDAGDDKMAIVGVSIQQPFTFIRIYSRLNGVMVPVCSMARSV